MHTYLCPLAGHLGRRSDIRTHVDPERDPGATPRGWLRTLPVEGRGSRFKDATEASLAEVA